MTTTNDADLRTATLISIREWALKQEGPLGRSARENYAIHGAVMQRVAQRLAEAVTARADHEGLVSLTFAEESPTWTGSDWEQRAAPNQAAFDLLDLVRAVLPTVDKPELLELELLPIVRFKRRREPAFTAVLVLLRGAGLKTTAVVFPVPGGGS